MSPKNDNLLVRCGKISWALAASLLGLPLPIVVIALLWGGCTHW